MQSSDISDRFYFSSFVQVGSSSNTNAFWSTLFVGWFLFINEAVVSPTAVMLSICNAVDKYLVHDAAEFNRLTRLMNS